jgi:hypothetical protein
VCLGTRSRKRNPFRRKSTAKTSVNRDLQQQKSSLFKVPLVRGALNSSSFIASKPIAGFVRNPFARFRSFAKHPYLLIASIGENNLNIPNILACELDRVERRMPTFIPLVRNCGSAACLNSLDPTINDYKKSRCLIKNKAFSLKTLPYCGATIKMGIPRQSG